MELPSLEAGWFGKLKEWTEIYKQNLPEGVHIQHSDIQSTFNSAHLIRGNDILFDFFDNPEALEVLLDKVTDYMLNLVPWLKAMISDDKDWFFDSGVLWKGTARISDRTMHLISPQMYVDYVFPSDIRFMEGIGGGRIHYCGTQDPVIDEFFKNPNVTGLDFDGNHHDLWDVAKRAPKNLVLQHWGNEAKTLERILNGDWPQKRNIIYQFYVSSMEEGQQLLKKLRESWERYDY